MKTHVQAANSQNTLERLDQIRMSPGERRRARAYLLQAELLADLLMRVDADLRRALAFAWQGVSVLAPRSKLPAVRPEPN